MEVSWTKLQDIIKRFEVDCSSEIVDLKLFLENLENVSSEMDGNEAVLRFFYELSKTV